MTQEGRPDILAYLALLERVPETFKRSWDAIAIYDLDGRVMRGNAAARAIVGPNLAAELTGNHFTRHLSLEEETKAARAFARCATLGEVVEGETVFLDGEGRPYPVRTRLVPARLDGQIVGVVGFARDPRGGREAEEQFLRATRIADLYRIAAAANVAAADKVSAALNLGVSELGAQRAFVGRLAGDAFEAVHAAGEGSGEEDADHVRRIIAAGGTVVQPGFAGAVLPVGGTVYGAVVFVSPAWSPSPSDGDRDYVAALATLIASAIQQAEREKRLDSLAFGDALTGLPNRALLQDRLEQTLLSARRHRRSFAAHYIDIDNFKSINDSYGHHVGDAVLIAVAAWLRTKLRDSDTIGRIGGDEFVVLQPEVDTQRQAEELAAKLCGIREHPFAIGSREIAVTISVGCAVFPVDGENPVDMLRAADTALYEVKNRGRNGFAVGLV